MEVAEDDVGFKVLIVELARRLPGFPSVMTGGTKVAQAPSKLGGPEPYRRILPVPSLPGSHFSFKLTDLDSVSYSMEALMPKSYLFVLLGLVWWTW